MSKVSTTEALLLDCVQDLHGAETAAVDAYPAIFARTAAPELRQALEAHAGQSLEQAGRLERVAEMLGQTARGPDCIWARGILDDALNDIRMVQPGPLLDTALIGAMRKLEQAEAVSYETAIAVARALGHEAAAELLAQTHDEELAMDARLRALLGRTVAAA